jgi:hypothetical protein
MADVTEIFADGTKIERDFTEQELAQIAIDKENAEKLEQEIIAKEKARENALQKLQALGLDIDDLKALGL